MNPNALAFWLFGALVGYLFGDIRGALIGLTIAVGFSVFGSLFDKH